MAAGVGSYGRIIEANTFLQMNFLALEEDAPSSRKKRSAGMVGQNNVPRKSTNPPFLTLLV